MSCEKLKVKYEKIFGKNYRFIWSDNWCIDDDIWFVIGAINLLVSIDKSKGKLVFLDKIPNHNINDFRLNPRCIKRDNYVICLPDRGNDIWKYCLIKHKWERIKIDNPMGLRIFCSNGWFVNNKLYIVSIGLKKILELNIDLNYIEKYYDISTKNELSIAGSILVDNCIYIVGVFPPKIYKFDCLCKKMYIYSLPKVSDYLETICYDGKRFWLSGRYKRIYLWEEGENISILDGFPESFGIYNFIGQDKKLLDCKENPANIHLFSASLFISGRIWFIPFQTNDILYIDSNNLKIESLPIVEELLTDEDIKNQLLNHRYLLQYVKDERYMGLFSLKNKWIFEIDCLELKYKILDYHLDVCELSHIDKYVLKDYYMGQEIRFENEDYDLYSLIQYIALENNLLLVKKKKEKFTIGQKIYN